MQKGTRHIIRYLLSLCACACLIFFILVFFYGIRIPGFQFDNFYQPTTYKIENKYFHFKVKGGFIKQSGHKFIARASSPHFEISLKGDLIKFPIVIENIHPDAILQSNNPYLIISEKIIGLIRHLKIQGEAQNSTTLKWVFPEKHHYRFMALGDTGGSGELEWALIRAKQLNADFVMHLGDMFYSHQDVHSALATINNSPVPVYSIYGNHDYYNNGEYPEKDTFNKSFSPSNFKFSLLGKIFISLDTSSHIFPFNKGKRGKFLDKILSEKENSDKESLLFTHQPIANSLYQDIPYLEHGLTGFEGAWLEGKLVSFKHLTVIAGHVHQSIQALDRLLPTYVAGDGIAHRDLIGGKPISKVLVGDIYKNQPTHFNWELNQIPIEYHTSLRSRSILEQHFENLASSNDELDTSDNLRSN